MKDRGNNLGADLDLKVQKTVENFKLFLNQEYVQKIAEEANCYAIKFQNSQGHLLAQRSIVHAWKPTTVEEIYIFLGLFMRMSIIQKPSLQSYLSTKRVIATPGFGDIITRERLELLCKFLHFSDNESQNTYQEPSTLIKNFPVIFHINSKFQTLYIPYHSISIHKSLTLWKGCLSFKQFLSPKSSQFSMKSFKFCDSQRGICGLCSSILVKIQELNHHSSTPT
jgi:hypothetical protein